jgi:hypothetical protein
LPSGAVPDGAEVLKVLNAITIARTEGGMMK